MKRHKEWLQKADKQLFDYAKSGGINLNTDSYLNPGVRVFTGKVCKVLPGSEKLKYGKEVLLKNRLPGTL